MKLVPKYQQGYKVFKPWQYHYDNDGTMVDNFTGKSYIQSATNGQDVIINGSYLKDKGRDINGNYMSGFHQSKGVDYPSPLNLPDIINEVTKDQNPYLITGTAPIVGFKSASLIRSPKIYKRAKSLRDSFKGALTESKPIKPEPYGVQPSHIYVKNGNVVSSSIDPENWNWDFSYKNARAAVKVQQNYENAMHRRRDYTYRRLKNHLFDDGVIGVKSPDDGSLLIEARASKVPTNKTIFHPTHFAPESLRKGYNLIRELAESSQPTMFTVTKDLSPMLEKQGFIKVEEIPQIFNGEMVTKDVLLNRSTTKESLINKLKEIDPYNDYTLDEQDLDKYIEILKSKKYPSRPNLNTFPIKDLLKINKK